MWPTLRDFLRVPAELTGKGIRIAVIDGEFPNHPDITTNEGRTTHIVRVMSESKPCPEVFRAKPEPWKGGWHALCAAAAAGGSGAESSGSYKGVAPEADLFLLAEYFPEQSRSPEKRHLAHIRALEWVLRNWRKYEIRAVMSARVHHTDSDSGILPWQIEPLRILCERLSAEGVLVIAGSGNVPDRTAAVVEAAAPSVLSVGGVAIPLDADPRRAEGYQGSRGTTFEGKWVPEILAPAENIVLPHRTDGEIEEHFYGKIDDLPRRHARTNGTSFSGPVILGAAACLWQAHPSWSALEMRSALIASSMKNHQWSALRSGLVSVRDALDRKPEATPEPSTSPYEEWSLWKKEPLEYRLDGLGESNPVEKEGAILSFIGDRIPPKAIEPIHKQVGHPEPRIRAAALCALAGESSRIQAESILGALQDSSPTVRMAGVYLIQKRPDSWSECRPCFIDLFDDPSLDVRYQSLRIAVKMAYGDFARTIAAHLDEDARMGRISNFAARTDALEAITGQRFALDPPWVHGNTPHANGVHKARVNLGRRWVDWLRDHSPGKT